MADFGDKRQAERDLDELSRQLSLNKEAKEVYPNISGLLGENSPEDYYRFKQQPVDQGFFSTKYPDKYKQDLVYGPTYKAANEQVSKDPALPYRNKELFPSVLKQLSKAPTDHVQKAFDARMVAENNATEALNADIIKAKDREDFINRVKQLEEVEGVPVHTKTLPLLTNLGGYYDPKKKEVILRDKNLGPILHELGHARTTKLHPEQESFDEGKRDILQRYLTRKYLQDPAYEKYILDEYDQRNPKEGIAGAPAYWLKNIPEEERLRLLNEALETGHGAMIARDLSAGHHGSDEILNYPIDRTMELYEQGLKQQGFEQEVPEESPKFEKLRSIIPTLRNLK